jgi:hypothetical protein
MSRSGSVEHSPPSRPDRAISHMRFCFSGLRLYEELGGGEIAFRRHRAQVFAHLSGGGGSNARRGNFRSSGVFWFLFTTLSLSFSMRRAGAMANAGMKPQASQVTEAFENGTRTRTVAVVAYGNAEYVFEADEDERCWRWGGDGWQRELRKEQRFGCSGVLRRRRLI